MYMYAALALNNKLKAFNLGKDYIDYKDSYYYINIFVRNKCTNAQIVNKMMELMYR